MEEESLESDREQKELSEHEDGNSERAIINSTWLLHVEQWLGGRQRRDYNQVDGR